MMSNPSSLGALRDVKAAVLYLHEQLNSNYSAVGELMSLRNADEFKLRDLCRKINSAYKNLIKIIEQAPTHNTSNLLEKTSENKL